MRSCSVREDAMALLLILCHISISILWLLAKNSHETKLYPELKQFFALNDGIVNQVDQEIFVFFFTYKVS